MRMLIVGGCKEIGAADRFRQCTFRLRLRHVEPRNLVSIAVISGIAIAAILAFTV